MAAPAISGRNRSRDARAAADGPQPPGFVGGLDAFYAVEETQRHADSEQTKTGAVPQVYRDRLIPLLTRNIADQTRTGLKSS